MQFSIRNLTEKYISSSYQDVLQQYTPSDTFYVLDGYGTVVFSLPSSSIGQMLVASNMTASMTVATASYLNSTFPINTSIGPIYVPTITNSGGYSFSVGTSSVNFCTSPNGSDQIFTYLLQSSSFTVTSSFFDVQYVVANYGNGNPFYSIETDYHDLNPFQTSVISSFTAGTNGNISWIDWDCSGRTLSNKILHRLIDSYGAQRSTGLMLGNSGSHITITSGTAFLGIKDVDLNSASTVNTRSFVLLSHNSSIWSESFASGIVNSVYDDGSSLQTLGSNKYVINYIWRGIENIEKSQILLSTQYNNYADAISSIMPAPPDELKNMSVFCGRMVIREGQSTPLLTESAFTTILSVAGITNHNELNNIQGGNTSEYYHLTSESYVRVISNTSSYSSSSYISEVVRSNVKVVSSSYSITLPFTSIVATGSTDYNITLPSASVNTGLQVLIKNLKNESNPLYIKTVGGEFIDEIQSSLTSSFKYSCINLQSYGTGWMII